jgi:ABC-2 type transport system permease protein
MRVFLKNIQKKWRGGILPPLSIGLFVPVIASIWPSLKAQAAGFQELLNNPIYKAFLGQVADISTWQGVFFMYIFVWMDWILIFASIFFPVRIISREVEKNTLDIALSYPISRWRYILEKFTSYMTYNLLYPLLLLPLTYFVTEGMGEVIDYGLVGQSLVGVCFLLFALGAMGLLCSSIFLDSGRSTAFAAVLVLGQYILLRVGQLTEGVSWLKQFSVFNYLNYNTVLQLGYLPTDELVIVAAIGIMSLISALYIFQRRELTY